MALIWLIGLVAVFAILCILWYIKYFKWQKYTSRYSGPPCIPIIGNVHCFGTGKDLLMHLQKYTEMYGETLNCIFGFSPRLFISGTKFIEFVLSSNAILDKSYDYGFFHSWLGSGLLTSTGAKWRQSRKFLTPAFHFKILERFVEVFEEQGNTFIETIEKFDGKEVDVFPYVTLYALDVICEASMNITVNAQKDSDSEYVHSVKEMCRVIINRIFSPVKMWDAMYNLSRDSKKEKKALQILHGFTNSVINKRKQELKENPLEQTTVEDVEVGTKRRVTFLDLLLQCTVDGKPLPQNVVREEVDTFMFEGHDTTTSGISFTLYSLSKHQDIQEKVFEEVQSICLDNHKPATYEDLQQMKYLDQVIKESLRLFPSVPMFARTLKEDTEFDGTVLPKGTNLSIAPFVLHRCPKLYPNPNIFDPERFSTENSRNRSHYAYIPFSAGPRNCIGQRFAILEMKSIISKIIKKFKLLPALGHEPMLVSSVILKSENGLPVRFQKRH